MYSPQKITPKHPPQTRLSWYTPKIIELLFSPFSHGFHYPFSFSTFRDFRNCLTFYHLFFLSFSSLLSNKKPSKGSCFLPPGGTSFLFSYSFYFLVSSPLWTSFISTFLVLIELSRYFFEFYVSLHYFLISKATFSIWAVFVNISTGWTSKVL